ncbi:MAG: citryl-CoA lyase [bacterium]|nr:citryl-CoA lyase [bacterium]
MWKTGITKVEPNHLVTRGYKQEDLIGNVSFSNVVFLLLKGKLPSVPEGKMIDAILTSSIDHGVTPPTALASRIVASAGVPLPTAVAAGILAVGDVHGGAIENSAKLLQEWAPKGKPEKIAIELLEFLKSKGKRMPGVGHRIHTCDPRTQKLFALANELKIAGKHIALMKAIETEITGTSRTGGDKGLKKTLPINVDGAIAAIVSDMGFDWKLGKAFFLLGRVAGLVAQVYEEQTREKPMRPICTVDAEYDGPWERNLPDDKQK